MNLKIFISLIMQIYVLIPKREKASTTELNFNLAISRLSMFSRALTGCLHFPPSQKQSNNNFNNEQNLHPYTRNTQNTSFKRVILSSTKPIQNPPKRSRTNVHNLHNKNEISSIQAPLM